MTETNEEVKNTEAAENSCVNCQHEMTCGYSMLATVGKRDSKYSYGKCILGLMSSGRPFFDKRVG